MNSPGAFRSLQEIPASEREVEDGNIRRLADKSWEDIQIKTFSNWVNTQLKIKGYTPIQDITQDFGTGEKLIQLLEIIGNESLGRYNKNPKLRLQKIENVNTALAFIKRRDVALTNIGAEDIVDTNAKLALGLCWSLILRFVVSEISEEGLTAKEGLLLWCQRRTTPYAQDFQIKDFTFSWQDGLTFCGLIHRHRPDLIDYWALDKSAKEANMQLAFDVAEQHLGIPKLFAVEDMTQVARPDERSVMTYVAQYFHAFAQQSKTGTAGRRVGALGQVLHQTWEMQNDYAERVAVLLAAVDAVQQQWRQHADFKGYAEAKQQLTDFESAYKTSTKRGWVAEKRALETLYSNIQTKLQTYKMRAYEAPAGRTPADLQQAWDAHVAVEAERKKRLTSTIRQIKEDLRVAFADAANAVQHDINGLSSRLAQLASVTPDLDEQRAGVQAMLSELTAIAERIEGPVAAVETTCVEAAIEDNAYTIYTVEDLRFELEAVQQAVRSKLVFIDSQAAARRHEGQLRPEQLEEITETFQHFDKDQDGQLTCEEFKAALQSAGAILDDKEGDAVFAKLAVDGHVNFDAYLRYARDQEEDRTDPEQLRKAFATLASESGRVTEADMYRAGMAPAVVEHLKRVLPASSQGEGYDYATFLDQLFH
ncbi:hypothetical protein CXG81DRAFT_25295 [Caulochytrium protostelioides]|uniref:Actinin-like protein n=2 Tax=Caulochytrium protostelioides TaxID=1555241 RepID=A0A4P9X9S8_9FUNG|nr:hypothetical protein CXG81DRAFT_25295 [Caulochytrium protostelioides]|eukprot:RKP02066.1 hypothetical protein CXG81DRAFT_25295 [Caulochytrium protostelioides]